MKILFVEPWLKIRTKIRSSSASTRCYNSAETLNARQSYQPQGQLDSAPKKYSDLYPEP